MRGGGRRGGGRFDYVLTAPAETSRRDCKYAAAPKTDEGTVVLVQLWLNSPLLPRAFAALDTISLLSSRHFFMRRFSLSAGARMGGVVFA